MNLPFGEWPSGSILFNPIMWGCMLPPKSLYYFHQEAAPPSLPPLYLPSSSGGPTITSNPFRQQTSQEGTTGQGQAYKYIIFLSFWSLLAWLGLYRNMLALADPPEERLVEREAWNVIRVMAIINKINNFICNLLAFTRGQASPPQRSLKIH